MDLKTGKLPSKKSFHRATGSPLRTIIHYRDTKEWRSKLKIIKQLKKRKAGLSITRTELKTWSDSKDWRKIFFV